jgi:hypothetical protein
MKEQSKKEASHYLSNQIFKYQPRPNLIRNQNINRIEKERSDGIKD